MEHIEVEKIYFDLDGVLADFEKGVWKICEMERHSQNDKRRSVNEDDEMWRRIKEAEHFYDRLELMPGAKEMFDTIYGRYGEKCEILTGIPKPKRGIETAAEDKRNWVHRLLSKEIRINIVYREEKPAYCTGKGYILIDDMRKNIADWNNMGGTGILHTNAEDTMKRLRELGVL